MLFENDQERWEFRKSVNSASSEHNHEMMHPDDMVKSWPKEVTDMIVDLARKRWATPCPMPDAAPVIRAVRPSSRPPEPVTPAR